jgi:hypothetical protein
MRRSWNHVLEFFLTKCALHHSRQSLRVGSIPGQFDLVYYLKYVLI